MKIGEAAKITGLTTRTIRYYEQQGLLEGAPRSAAGYRQYERAHIESLEFVKKAKRLGLSLDEIRDVLAIHRQRGTPCVHVLALLDQKVEQLDALITDLNRFRRELRRLRDESQTHLDQLPEGARVCRIIERSAHARGEVAMAWLERRRSQA